MYCPVCNIIYEDPEMRFCTCGRPLVPTPGAAQAPPQNPPRTTSGWANETIYVQAAGRQWGVRRTYLLIFVLLMLLLLLCCCLNYIDVLAAPRFITDILGVYTPLAVGCGSGILFLFIVYVFIIILRLDFNCIYVPAILLVLVVICAIAGWLGWVELPDFVDRVVIDVTDPIRVLPLPFPWDPKTRDPNKPDQPPAPGDCCTAEDVTDIYQKRETGGMLYTVFDIHFKDCLPVWGSQCLEGKAYVGETQSGEGKRTAWVDVICCEDLLKQNVLHCDTAGYEDQVSSWVWVEFDDDECPFEVGFQSLYQVKDPEPVPPSTDKDSDSDSDSDSEPESTCPVTSECGPCCGTCRYDTSSEAWYCSE